MGLMEWLLLAISVGLVLACGVFGAAEYSFVAIDRSAVDKAASDGDRQAQGVLKALRSLSTQLSGAQIGVTLTNLAIGFLAEPAIATLLESPLKTAGVPAGAVPGISVTLGLTLATIATMLFGELVPKKLGIAIPFPVARRTQVFIRGFTTLMTYPI
ncbi:MAG: HlyC/CorC family transporter, partial [Marmoricola sp.]|nr:HlyC/CorC family transporter [Marmoricola sp.]